VAAIGAQNDGQGSFFIDSHAPLLRCERCKNGLWAPFCAPRSPPLNGTCTRKRPSEGRNRHLAPTGASQIQANSRPSRYLVYSRSPKNPALQQLQKSSKSASTTPQRPIWNSFATVGVRDFWENGCKIYCAAPTMTAPAAAPAQGGRPPPATATLWLPAKLFTSFACTCIGEQM